jgi:two-component system, oxyanion-binding sensor
MRTATPIVIGFIPLLDCAPIVVAAEKGFAREEGLELALMRETSWANIRDRIIVGHFDAAHMLGPMAVASSLGIGHLKVPMVAPLSLGLGGNAITVSRSLWEAMLNEGSELGAAPASQGLALKRVIAARAEAGHAQLTFAMVYPFSCHNYELRYWLCACGIDPDHDVRLVVIPPPLLVDAMREGQIDGFCVGEPWNSQAVSVGVGHIVTPTTAIWRLSPEKVLGCRADWAERYPDRLDRLVRAVYRAAWWCERRENHAELARLLAEPRFVGAPADILARGIANELCFEPGAAPRPIADFYVRAANAATFPWVSHALWFYAQMVRWKQIEPAPAHVKDARATYRPDLYRRALVTTAANVPIDDLKIEGAARASVPMRSSQGALAYGPDGFFDDRRFDPQVLVG